MHEMIDFLERLRHDALVCRKSQRASRPDPSLFPKYYDRVHMSNIPSAAFPGSAFLTC